MQKLGSIILVPFSLREKSYAPIAVSLTEANCYTILLLGISVLKVFSFFLGSDKLKLSLIFI